MRDWLPPVLIGAAVGLVVGGLLFGAAVKGMAQLLFGRAA